MVLNRQTSQRIQDYIFKKPRTIQEIAELLKVNWRTADRYVEKISKEEGTVEIRTFRPGTRGSLKIVYWINLEQISSTSNQERLFKQIESSRQKVDFSPFEIYQYLEDNKRRAFVEEDIEGRYADQDLIDIISQAEEQLLIFSGNLSWVNIDSENKPFLSALKKLIEKKVSVKILCNIDIGSIQNVEKVLALNFDYSSNPIEIRHSEQPLRAFIIDNKLARFKESKKAKTYTLLKKKTYIFYEVTDESWIEWLRKVFWNLFRPAVPAEKRIKDIWSIQNLK